MTKLEEIVNRVVSEVRPELNYRAEVKTLSGTHSKFLCIPQDCMIQVITALMAEVEAEDMRTFCHKIASGEYYDGTDAIMLMPTRTEFGPIRVIIDEPPPVFLHDPFIPQAEPAVGSLNLERNEIVYDPPKPIGPDDGYVKGWEGGDCSFPPQCS